MAAEEAASHVVLYALDALYAATHAIDPQVAVKPALLAQHNIVVTDDTMRRPHPHRTSLDAIVAHIAAHPQHDLHPLGPSANIARLACPGHQSPRELVALLAGSARDITHAVQDPPPPPTTVEQFGACPRDCWLSLLRTPPLWDCSAAWGVECILGVGQQCSGECGGELPYCHENAVGCLLPIRTQLATDQPMHLGELLCTLVLLHRQLAWNCDFAHTITVVSVTADADVRVHEASVHPSPTDDGPPRIRIVKCLDLNIADADGKDSTARENWLDVISYIAFTYEANLDPTEPNEQPLKVRTTQENNQDIIAPEQENIQPSALTPGEKAATKTTTKGETPRRPRTPLAPKNV
ncbi:hypothetical protein P171DRAFT_477954 [Karstenula rhodostoma CBS 690.94]|uniref:Uncharacterized protein n=1 Tax=Karstenula rhodostoma CBS 690.94 TaxID=1392251 RepID=A0A9P4P5H5_9PLEO|nr:hypothetical protein P171DRAFT_477954 [Karstenula rhodostoma CBS 690.94]